MKTRIGPALLVLSLAAATLAQSRPSAPVELVRTIALEKVDGRIDHLAVDQSGRLFVAALENNTLEVIDLAKGARSRQIEGIHEPQGVCALPSGKLVVASGHDGMCRIFDESLKLAGSIDGLSDADNVRFDAAAQRVYVGYGSGALAVVDPQKAAKTGTIALDAHPESFQLETKGRRVFVNVPKAGHVAVVDREKAVVVAKWPLGDLKDKNYPMALDEADQRLFVACRKPAKLVVLDTESGKQIAVLDCCGDADDVFWDEARRRIYVSGGHGKLCIFESKDRDRYSLLATEPTPQGARTCLFVPSANRIYLAVPHRGDQRAEIRELRLP